MRRILPGLLFLTLGGCAADIEFDTLYISIDGASRVLVTEEWENLPTLGGLVEEPIPMRIQGVTNTRASHGRMLTGYPPTVSGIIDEGRGRMAAQGLSIHEHLREAFGGGLYLAYVVSKPAHLGCEEDEGFYYLCQASDYHYQAHTDAEDIVDEMVEAIDKAGHKPLFAFFHFAPVDTVGHQRGERSIEQRSAIQEIDQQIGLVLDAQAERDRPLLLYITADHGFAPGESNHMTDARDVWLITNDAKVSVGGINDQIPWTILDRYGVTVEDAPEQPL